MLPTDCVCHFRLATIEEVKRLLSGGFESAVGHDATADFLTRLLGIPVHMRRVALQLTPGDVLAVFQIMQRLPEGKLLTADELANVPYKFFIVHVQ